MLPPVPLSPEAEALKRSILAIPRTDEPLSDDLPAGLTEEQLERLHHAALAGPPWIIPELKKAIARFPEYPTLMNYLRVAYQMKQQNRQADQVLKDLARLHPEYLFTRLGIALQAMESNQSAKAIEALGAELDIRKLYPKRGLFHVSELKSYYACVAIIHAREGEPGLAHGVRAALLEIVPDADMHEDILREIMRANAKGLQERIRKDDELRIEAKIPPLSLKITTSEAPSFHHEEVNFLYECGFGISEKGIRLILELPRETLVADLIRVLDDAVVRTPNFMRAKLPDQETCAPVHALHFLADLRATEALESVLRFLSLHPDALGFWLGDLNYSPLLARLIQDRLPRATEWLKSPGISTRGKCQVMHGMVHLARSEARYRGDVVSCFGDVLSFLLTTPREDHILDTQFVSFLICDVLNLRAKELLPLIEQAWEKNLIEQFITGDLAAITADLSEALPPAPKPFSITGQYRSYFKSEPAPAPSRTESFRWRSRTGIATSKSRSPKP